MYNVNIKLYTKCYNLIRFFFNKITLRSRFLKGFYTKRILLNKLNVVLRPPWPHLNQDAIVRERKWLLETGYKISSQDCFDYIYKKIFLICSKFYHTKMFNLIKRNISRHVIRYLNRDESFKFLRKNLIL